MKLLTTIVLLLCISKFSHSQDNVTSKRTKHYNLEKGLAIQGYDPVSYFQKGGPLKGKKELIYLYNGVSYHFANNENLELFQKNPVAYEPAYGGWCAYAMGNDGSKVEVDPETFKVVNGKLYLFYNFYFNNTLKKWNPDEQQLKKKADAYWTNIIAH